MKKIVIVVIGMAIVLTACFSEKGSTETTLSREGTKLTIKAPGKNVVNFTFKNKISNNYRVFSLGPNNYITGPSSYFTSLIAILPGDVAKQILVMERNEGNAMNQAKLLPVVCSDSEVAKKLDKCQEYFNNRQLFYIQLKGEIFVKNSHTFNGEKVEEIPYNIQKQVVNVELGSKIDESGTGQVSSESKTSIDNMILLLKDIENITLSDGEQQTVVKM